MADRNADVDRLVSEMLGALLAGDAPEQGSEQDLSEHEGEVRMVANFLFDTFTIFREAGFTNDQAFSLTKGVAATGFEEAVR